LNDIIEHVPVALKRVDEDGTILWANENELQLLGYSLEEYVGHNLVEFHVDEAVIREIRRRLSSEQRLDRYDARLRSRDGSIRYVTVYTSTSRESGRAIHICVTVDHGEPNTASEVHQRLAAIVESSDDAILSKDLNGIIQSWNCGAERIFGYKAEEIVGKHISTLAVPDRLDEFPDILDRIRRGERVDHYETIRKAKDGRLVSVSLTVSPVRNESGTIVGASKVARDITERRSKRCAR
jgi:PAS domain S-box-containing protein